MLERAIGLSLYGQEDRKFRLAAIGVRKDGCFVFSTNGGVKGAQAPSAHAESRVSRKVDVGSIVYVARTLKDGKIAMAKPCQGCVSAMKNRGVYKCYYTISDDEYGCILLNKF